ncbi:MAG: DMT family transporter [Anaerolineales bacterium]
MRRNTLVPYLEATFVVVIWGASFIATKVALQEIQPVTIVWIRFTIGVLILGAAVALRKQFTLPDKKEWGYFAVLGFLGITFHQWLQSNGLQTSEASTTAWIVSTTPVFMALLGWLILRERIGLMTTLGIALAFIGVLLVSSKGDIASISVGKFGAPGDFLIMISAINWAVFSILSRRGLKAYPASLMMFYLMALGWIFTSILFLAGPALANSSTPFIHNFLAGPGFGDIANLTPKGWMGILFLGVFCSGLAYIAWYDALQALSTAETGVFLYVEPLVAVVVAAIVLSEKITGISLIGGAIILFGVWLVNRK